MAGISFFKGSARSITAWGDYGDILQHGMTMHSPRVDGRLALERTGPYIPPITFPGRSIILTDAARTLLESSGLTTFSFVPVEKKLIVELHWESWNLSAEEPANYPSAGEPEDYILGKPHSQKLADAMGDVWEVILTDGAVVDTEIEREPSDYDVRVHIATWKGAHLFWGKKPDAFFGRWIIVTERGKRWLEENAGEWVRFKAMPVK